MGGALRFTTTIFDWRAPSERSERLRPPRRSSGPALDDRNLMVLYVNFATAAHHELGGSALASQGVPAEDASEANILGRHEKRVARHWSIGTFW
jgi:hypothetical protein